MSYQELVNEKNEAYDTLYWVDLRGVHLEGENLTGAILKKADLTDAILTNAHLSSSYLQKARLDSAQLQGANLSDAQLQGADLIGARLDSADLSNAQIQGAKNLTIWQLAQVKTLMAAQLDSTLYEQVVKNYPQLLTAKIAGKN